MIKYTMRHFWIFSLAILYSFHFVDAAVQCEQKNVTVQFPSTSPNSPCPTYSIATWLCWKQGTQLNANKVVHLTISGFTYDHTYWSFSYQPSKYSYVDYVIEKSNGRIVVLNIDRLAVGMSSKPLQATNVTIDSHAYVIYQLTKKLNQRVFRNIQFGNIILVSHSLGTVIAWRVVSDANYNQYIKGLIATGLSHEQNMTVLDALIASFYPAQSDPKFSGQSIPNGYVTTNPFNKTRQSLFYYTNGADPNVIAMDEKLKQTGTPNEVFTGAPVFPPNVTRMIPKRIRVLAVTGQYDLFVCDASSVTLRCNNSAAIIEREQPNYSYSIEAYVLPRAGHSINLHRNAQDWYQQALIWTQRYYC